MTSCVIHRMVRRAGVTRQNYSERRSDSIGLKVYRIVSFNRGRLPSISDPTYAMSYTQSYNVSYSLLGGKAGLTTLYKLPLTPRSDSDSFYAHHFRSALTAKITSCAGTIVVPAGPSDKFQPIAIARIVDAKNTAKNVAQLARGLPFSTGGNPQSFSLSDAVGVRSIIKGVFDNGGAPALHIAIFSTDDLSTIITCHLSMIITVEFDGSSDDVAFDLALPKPSS